MRHDPRPLLPLGTTLLLAGCAGPQSALDPAEAGLSVVGLERGVWRDTVPDFQSPANCAAVTGVAGVAGCWGCGGCASAGAVRLASNCAESVSFGLSFTTCLSSVMAPSVEPMVMYS